jgi:hypothetical protein
VQQLLLTTDAVLSLGIVKQKLGIRYDRTR